MDQDEVVSGKELDESLDATLRETLKGLNDRGEGVTEEPADPIKGIAAVVDDKDPAPSLKGVERARDDTGKFVKAEDKPKESAAPAEKPDKTAQSGAVVQVAAEVEAPPVTTTGQPIDINRPPSSWKPAAKAAWAALPEPIRAEVHRRESDFLNGVKGIKENADFGQSIRSVVEPYRMLIEAEGGTPERAVGDLLKTAALFRTGTQQAKLEAIFGLDQKFNAGLNQHFNQAVEAEVAKRTGQPAPQVQQQPQNFQDPRVDQLLAANQKQERDRVAQEERITNAATERFLFAKDDKGQPLYPFVDNVIDDMSQRVSGIRRNNPAIGHEEALKQAYEAAVWAHPETRAVLISQQQAQAQQSAETLRKVEQAKRASAGNMPRRGALPATEPVGSIEDTIRDTYRRLTG